MKKKLLAALMMGILMLQGTAGDVLSEEAAVEEEQVEAEDEKFATGTVDGQTYVQDFFGFRVDLGENWAFASEEDMQALGNQVSNAGSDAIKEAIDSGTSYLDMYAENGATFQNINATITKISITEAVMFEAAPDEIISMMIEPVKDQMELVGLSGAEVTQDEIEFMGETVPCIKISSHPDSLGGDIGLYQTQVYFQEGTYLCSLTASSYVDDTTEEVLAMCSRV